MTLRALAPAITKFLENLGWVEFLRVFCELRFGHVLDLLGCITEILLFLLLFLHLRFVFKFNSIMQ
jgi:hypothetical protein